MALPIIGAIRAEEGEIRSKLFISANSLDHMSSTEYDFTSDFQVKITLSGQVCEFFGDALPNFSVTAGCTMKHGDIADLGFLISRSPFQIFSLLALLQEASLTKFVRHLLRAP